jgi:TonB family protein
MDKRQERVDAVNFEQHLSRRGSVGLRGGPRVLVLSRRGFARFVDGLIGVLVSAVLSGQTFVPAPTRSPRLTGGFGRLPGTPVSAPLSDTDFLPSQALSFDTRGHDWSAYEAEMVRRIQLHWDVPELARQGWKASLTIRFFILAVGRVRDATVVRSSGIPPFDDAAVRAIRSASPFPTLPQGLHEDREGVTVTFLYNIDSPRRARTPRPIAQDATSLAVNPSAPDAGLPPPRTAGGAPSARGGSIPAGRFGPKRREAFRRPRDSEPAAPARSGGRRQRGRPSLISAGRRRKSSAARGR